MSKDVFMCLFALWLFCCCSSKQEQLPAKQILPMDSSAAIIMETTGLLRQPCIPDCWPRDFSKKKRLEHYVAYVQKNLYHRDTTGRTNFENSKRSFPEVDSSFYALINYATINYAAAVKGKELTLQDIRSLSNERVKVGLINGSKGYFAAADLGYIELSPVVVNEQRNKGVFFYQLRGELVISYLICIRKESGKWILANKSRLAIS